MRPGKVIKTLFTLRELPHEQVKCIPSKSDRFVAIRYRLPCLKAKWPNWWQLRGSFPEIRHLCAHTLQRQAETPPRAGQRDRRRSKEQVRNTPPITDSELCVPGKSRKWLREESWRVAPTNEMQRAVSRFSAASCSQLLKKEKETEPPPVNVRIPSKTWPRPQRTSRQISISATQA